MNRVAALVILITVIWLTGTHSEPPPIPVLAPSPYDEEMLNLDEEAVKQAYKTQVEHLFEVWMRDEKDQPRRAVTGVQYARKAYIAAMGEIEKRRRIQENKQ